MKDGIDAFDVDKVTPLLFVVDLCHAIMQNDDILKVQSLAVIWELSTDVLAGMKVPRFGRPNGTNVSSMGFLHHVQFCGLCFGTNGMGSSCRIVRKFETFFSFLHARNSESALHWLLYLFG